MSIETKQHESTTYRIYDELKKHVGKQSAISASELSGMFNISERQLRDYIHEIREDMQFDKVILACNQGYYIPTEEEGTADVKRLFNHAFSTLRIARATVTKGSRNGQGKIKLGKYYKEFVESFGE
ncbi:MAG: hypothetical protein J1F33_05530 [Clostridiales bacterium]|nr:hypothetical protein [Clostridiales bacterium]